MTIPIATSDNRPAEQDSTQDDQTQDTADNTDVPEDDPKAMSDEAARYRRQLRATEKENTKLQATVDALRQAEVERLASESFIKPAALWAAGTKLDDLLAADGTVDPAKVNLACQQAADMLGISRLIGPRSPHEGTQRNDKPNHKKASAMARAFTPAENWE